MPHAGEAGHGHGEDADAEQHIAQNELAFFPKGMHHVIREASDVNRLCVLMIPGFLGEVPSDKL